MIVQREKLSSDASLMKAPDNSMGRSKAGKSLSNMEELGEEAPPFYPHADHLGGAGMPWKGAWLWACQPLSAKILL